ncbi:hypothetical protein ABZ876_27915 [Streptomyces sp. NPDC046931]|uniref:hypothetical protein n=1 Tax=Streptomyces sp. NPDC046931 TaxID=3154806 RepID=UPI00340CFDF3
MHLKRSLGLATAATLTTIGLAALAAPAAHADEWACTYPAVCFFKGYERTGSFVDITSGWQTLTSSKNATGAWNTRNDDGALLHFTNGRRLCLRPGDSRNDLRTIGTVDKIRIMDSPSC